jgi:hypothetical protein
MLTQILKNIPISLCARQENQDLHAIFTVSLEAIVISKNLCPKMLFQKCSIVLKQPAMRVQK